MNPGASGAYKFGQGIVFDNPYMASSCTHALLSAWSQLRSENLEAVKDAKLITVTSNGFTKKSYNALPFILRPFYKYILAIPRQDKRATEHLISQCATNSESYECDAEEVAELEKAGALAPNWKESLSQDKWLDAVVVRPSILTDGKSLCEIQGAKAIRTGPEDLCGTWNVSRRDVGWFIARMVVKDYNTWNGRAITVSY